MRTTGRRLLVGLIALLGVSAFLVVFVLPHLLDKKP
jgi:hypothetical protein